MYRSHVGLCIGGMFGHVGLRIEAMHGRVELCIGGMLPCRATHRSHAWSCRAMYRRYVTM